MDPGQLGLTASLEKQISPFSSKPPLLAQPAESKLWKEHEARGREASDSTTEPRVTSSAAGIYSLHGKKGLQNYNPQIPLTTLSVSFHTSIDFAEHALRITKAIMNISTQTTRLLAHHLSGIHLSHGSIFRAELGLLISTVGITEPDDASNGTR